MSVISQCCDVIGLATMVEPVLTSNLRQNVGLSYIGACICTCDCFSQKCYLCNSRNDLIKSVLAAFLSVELLKLDFLSQCFDIKCFEFIVENYFQPMFVPHVHNCFNTSQYSESTGLSINCSILINDDLTYLLTVPCLQMVAYKLHTFIIECYVTTYLASIFALPASPDPCYFIMPPPPWLSSSLVS
jgi:hypothetical protein